ncbi:MAG: hypothetical protein GY946_09015 [bacterium]|nr:hypothetical protein [bacterium]
MGAYADKWFIDQVITIREDWTVEFSGAIFDWAARAMVEVPNRTEIADLPDTDLDLAAQMLVYEACDLALSMRLGGEQGENEFRILADGETWMTLHWVDATTLESRSFHGALVRRWVRVK